MNKWLGLSAAMVMMGCAGLTYTYAVYSEEMKEKLHFSQEQIDDIGAAKDLGGVVGLFSGIFYNLYPPWVTITIGALLHFYGYFMIWMTVAGKVSPSFRLLCVYSALGNGGDSWSDTACMMASLQNFEEHRGTVLGILKAQLGLSAAIFVMIYETLLEPNVNQFILLMTLLPAFAYASLAIFIRPFQRKSEDVDPNIRFKMAFNMIVFLGLYMMFSVTSKELFHMRKWFKQLILVVMLIIMITMYIIPIAPIPAYFLKKPLDDDLTEGTELQGLTRQDEEEQQPLKQEDDNSAKQPLDLTSHLTLRDCLKDYNFWLIFVVVTVGAGAGVAIINNLAQIGIAIQAGETDVYVGLISVWSCFGRLGSGYGSDYMMKHGFPRTLCLLITQLLMALCCLLLATGLVSSLLVGSALTGLSYGAYWTLVPAILSDVFGLHNFTVLYKLVSLGPTIGSYLLSAKVLGYLYDEQSELYLREHPSSLSREENSCYGPKCFGFGLLALSFISFVGALASFLLVLATSKFYRNANSVT